MMPDICDRVAVWYFLIDRTLPRRAMNNGRVPFGRWIFRLVAWDGVLPVVVLLAPTVIKVLFPNWRGAIEIAAIALPITAFLIRFYVAKRHITSNECSGLVRCFQFIALCVAILIFLLIDALLILVQDLPNGALVTSETDLIVWAVLITLYLSCMAFVLYPGRTEEVLNVEGRNPDPL